MKRVLCRILAGIIDFYYLTWLIGLFLIGIYIFIGPFNVNVLFGIVILSLLIVSIYHFFNKKFQYLSPGEVVIGIDNNTDKIQRSSKFKITRFPLYLLIIFSLALTSNLLDGLIKNGSYSIFNLLLITLIFNCLYRGIKNFIIHPSILSILVICGGLFLQVMIYKGKFMMIGNNFIGLLIAWIIIGGLYTQFFKMKEETTD